MSELLNFFGRIHWDKNQYRLRGESTAMFEAIVSNGELITIDFPNLQDRKPEDIHQILHNKNSYIEYPISDSSSDQITMTFYEGWEMFIIATFLSVVDDWENRDFLLTFNAINRDNFQILFYEESTGCSFCTSNDLLYGKPN